MLSASSKKKCPVYFTSMLNIDCIYFQFKDKFKNTSKSCLTCNESY